MKSNARTIFIRLLIGIHLLMSLGLLLLHFLPSFNQTDFWFINLLALALPFLLVFEMGFFFFWLIMKSKWKWLSVLTIILSWNFISTVFAVHFFKTKAGPEDPTSTLRITTWNVRLFNYHEKRGSFDTTIIQKIKALKPTIISMQEMMYAKDTANPLSIDHITTMLGFQYHAVAKEEEQFKSFKSPFTYCGVILSNYPIIASQTIAATNENNSDFLSADIVVGKDTFRVFNFHLQSLFFNQQDYTSLSQVKKGKIDQALPGGKTILKKMKAAWSMRASQVDHIVPYIQQSPYPVIICGDFNDVPVSYAYQQLSQGLIDAHQAAGAGIGRSFKFISPTLRIDYILTDQRFKPYHAFVDPESTSDHYSFTADFRLK